MTNHISSTPAICGYHIGQDMYRTFPSLQKVQLDSAALDLISLVSFVLTPPLELSKQELGLHENFI